MRYPVAMIFPIRTLKGRETAGFFPNFIYSFAAVIP